MSLISHRNKYRPDENSTKCVLCDTAHRENSNKRAGWRIIKKGFFDTTDH